MFILPDLTSDFEAFERRHALHEPVESPGGGWALWGRAAVFCVAGGLLLAALGLWAFPAEDSAVRLVKLGASLGFFGAGAVLLRAALVRPERERVEIDTRRREIRTYDVGVCGQVILTGRHRLDDMTDITLRDGTFCARDRAGRVTVSAPVRGRAKARALRRALVAG